MLASFSSGLTNAINFGTNEGLTGLTLETFATSVYNLIFSLATTVALAALVWGGMMYIISLGNESRVATAKRTIVYSIVGLVVVGAARLIQLIVIDIRSGALAESLQLRLTFLILNLIQLLVIPAGIIAFGAIVYGGYLYIISAGDEGKASTGKRVIIYAIVGLIIIGLAGIVVNAVVNQIPAAPVPGP